jgi:hypothetical protein
MLFFTWHFLNLPKLRLQDQLQMINAPSQLSEPPNPPVCVLFLHTVVIKQLVDSSKHSRHPLPSLRQGSPTVCVYWEKRTVCYEGLEPLSG